MSEESIDVEDLRIGRAADATGFEDVSTRLFGWKGGGPSLLICAVVAIHIPLLSLLGYVRTGTRSMAENPGESFQMPAWIAIAWITKRPGSNRGLNRARGRTSKAAGRSLHPLPR